MIKTHRKVSGRSGAFCYRKAASWRQLLRLLFICLGKFIYDPLDAFDLPIRQTGNIQRFAAVQTQEKIGGYAEKQGEPDQNIKRGISHAHLILADYGLGKPDVCTKLLLRHVSPSAELFQLFSKITICQYPTTLALLYGIFGI